uniref:Putative rna-binding protein rrm superfamily n=1 Tax=Corethrella appendiculata TaxID=1370023 RepID=U5EZQ2_9DIPT
MSRIFIKNLPNKITEEKLREHFSKLGIVTDVQLKYTKDGKFRNFGFVGFETDEQAGTAIKHFNNTYLKTSKISVELCADLNDESTKPKSWSKYSKEKLEEKLKKEKVLQAEDVSEKVTGKTKSKKSANEILDEHKNDPMFKEFMEVHGKSKLWENQQSVDNEVADGEDENDDDDEESETDEKIANKQISDEDYKKALMSSTKTKSTKSGKKLKLPPNKMELFVLKITNIPFKTKRHDLVKFFRPLKPFSIRIPPRSKGFAFIGYKTESDFKKALLKHKSFMDGKQIEIVDYTEKDRHKLRKAEEVTSNNDHDEIESPEKQNNPKWIRQKEALQSENICESGKLFFRNLPYSVNEEEIKSLFEKYGPVAEIDVPIDQQTRKLKGFGTVTFMMPEHAVKAYTNLNGTQFHGRLFHILPATSNDNQSATENDDEKLTFKEKKEKKLKQQAQSSHNWNTLFLGENAVANILAKRYDTSKEKIFDSNGAVSAAVRLALGETEIVLEMKQFLEHNDVALDVLDVAPKDRSNVVILAKNLPADTEDGEIRKIFSKFGLLGRVVLPPSGVTALIEFLEPSEAKKAFKKLAYTKFKNLPLYLEWAPDKIFKTAYDPNQIKTKSKAKNAQKTNEKDGKTIIAEDNNNNNDDDQECEEGTTLFLKNLSFDTREAAIREHFKYIGQIHSIQVVMKKNDQGMKESRGYGFIQFKTRKAMELALKQMQFTEIDGRQVELSRSDRVLQTDVAASSKKKSKSSDDKKQTGTKILVRNVPFQANQKEIRDLFKAFGEIKTIRLPKKMTPGTAESHRGFCFVDFMTLNDAKSAFDALSKSTHLYGRRLVLEWASVDDTTNLEELRKRTAEQFVASTNGAKRSRKSVFDTTQIEDLNVDNE